MKTWLVVIGLCLFSSLVIADQKAEKLDEVKAKITSNLDERISQLQKMKSCVSSAKDRAALKACREDMKSFRQERRAERKAKRNK